MEIFLSVWLGVGGTLAVIAFAVLVGTLAFLHFDLKEGKVYSVSADKQVARIAIYVIAGGIFLPMVLPVALLLGIKKGVQLIRIVFKEDDD